MSTKRCCDFCGNELTDKSYIGILRFLSEKKDVCRSCSEKIKEFLDSIKKLKE